jgi:hypothetical protein
MNTKGDVIGYRPVDDYRPVPLQVGGKVVHQGLGLENKSDEPVFATPVSPQGAAPDGAKGDLIEQVEQMIVDGTDPHVLVHDAVPQEKRDELPIDVDVLLPLCVERRMMPLYRRTKPASLEGKNGLTRSGTLERTSPPWAEKWE